MNLNEIIYREISTSSLSVGSTFSEDDLMFYTGGKKSINFPFGKLDSDVLKVSVFDLDNTLVSSSMVYAGGTYTPVSYTHLTLPTKRIV